MNTIRIKYVKTQFGELILGSIDESLCLCDWRYRKMRREIDSRLMSYFDAEYIVEETDIINKAVEQLEEYFSGSRKEFDIDLKPAGTQFQLSVWNELMNIPYGRTETYLGLSQKLGNERAIRAVSSANGANAISIIIPCHRVIGSDGGLRGYAGGIATKKKLLELERVGTSDQTELFG